MTDKATISPKISATEAATILNTTVQNIHKKIKNLNIEKSKTKNRVYFGHSVSKKIFNFQLVPKVFSFQLVKGGVGKTAISYMFSIQSLLLGAKVALIEIDQQANLTRSCGVNAADKPILADIITQKLSFEEAMIPVIDGLDLLPSRVDNALLDNILMLGKHPLDKVLAKPIQKLKKKYDLIVIDCPPSIGASVAAAALASDVIIMPVNPTDYSIAGLELTYNEIKELVNKYEKNPDIKILFNKYDARTTLSFTVMSQLIKHPLFSSKMVQSYIRINQGIENSISKGKTIFDNIKSSPEKEDFLTTTRELLGL